MQIKGTYSKHNITSLSDMGLVKTLEPEITEMISIKPVLTKTKRPVTSNTFSQNRNAMQKQAKIRL